MSGPEYKESAPYPPQGAPPAPGFVPPYPAQGPPAYTPYPAPPHTTAPPPTNAYGSTNVIIPNRPPEVIVIGGCPNCRAGVLEDDYSMLGICCAILFFPIGVLCCLAMKQRQCSNCRAVF